MSINNGRLLPVKLPDFDGEAGFVEREGSIQLAYVANRAGKRLEAGAVVNAGDKTFTVLKAGRSAYSPHLTVLDLAVS